ncbi:MAG: PQQ-dependent sugar dehydrogenase, partial [Gammaproteobacteria bacterium]|nr:PQQ-dependent sugar dehydrogenase [Gammaproteobacteria bacterium]
MAVQEKTFTQPTRRREVMRLRKCVSMLALGAGFAALSGIASADVKVRLEPYVTGVNAPLAMVQPAGDDRKFVVEQWGRIRIIDGSGKLQATPFLDIRNLIPELHPDFDERGLLGLAFHPDFKQNGKFYVSYSGHKDFQQDLGQMLWYSHNNTVAEYTVSSDDPDSADPNSGRVLTNIPWPQFNHNGHWIGFGPDGMLYISTGDGGYANDWGIGHNVTEGNGQDLTAMHGKILRIDVNKMGGGKNYGIPSDNPFVGNANAQPEIWAYGLRNPWRCSFDMRGGRLFCGDVQQNSFEEVSLVSKGANLGWRRMEATHCFDYVKPDNHPSSCDKSGLVQPILEYQNCTAKPNGCKGISVTGGYVYRGSNSSWNGKYIFGDWSKSFAAMDGQIFVATESGGKWTMEVA